MAALRTSAVQTALRETRRAPYVCPQCELRQLRLSPFNELPRRIQARYYASTTDAGAPPLLAKIKGDLKTAMRAKDTPRLNVLRTMISEYNNASKTNTPIKTDIQLLALLKKSKAAKEAAAVEAKAANRQDLEEKNMEEIKVIDEYAGEVQIMPESEVLAEVDKLIEQLKQAASSVELKAGNVLKELLNAGGALAGKNVDKGQVAKIVNDKLQGK